MATQPVDGRKGVDSLMAMVRCLFSHDPLTGHLCSSRSGATEFASERTGCIIGMPDVMMAAIALASRLPIVAGNVAHFEQVRLVGYDLTIDNWKSA